MMAKIIGIVGVAATILLIFLINTTTPSTIGPLGVLVIFLCIYLMTLSLLTLVLWQGGRLFVRLSRPFTVRRPFHILTLRQSYYFSSVLALAPVMLLGMQSVGKVGFYELLLVALFAMIGCVYIAKRST